MHPTDTTTTANRTPHSRDGSSLTSTWKYIRQSPVVLGIALFVIANILLLAFQPLSKVDPDSLPAAHTWTWWATREYLDQANAPAVVLLGSSLMMHPVSRQDADFLNKDLDYVHHHKSAYLESSLTKLTGSNKLSCFNYALPGSMISDNYMVARALFSGDKKPKMLVLGLSLRDFIDSGVNCPAATPPFRYLKRFVNINDIVNLAMPQIWQRIDYNVGNMVYLYNKKLDTQVLLSEYVKAALGPLMRNICVPSLIEKLDPAKNLPSNLRSEVEENMFIVKTHQPYSWEDNSKEYIKRYRMKNTGMFDIQAKFLSQLLAYCKAQNIAVLIVNMPLTPKNMALMPAGYYNHYLSKLKESAVANDSPLVDLNSRSDFKETDFYDTSHMNATGGKKLLDRIAETIASNTTLSAAINSHAPTQLAEHGSGTLQ